MRKINKNKQIEIEAATFRKLLEHLRAHTEVQNIDLMNLANFCRNCLSKWYKSAAEERGVKIVCYANHMLRSAYPSMLKVARSILMQGRSKESDDDCMPIKEILELIPGTK